jgi:hypothetical protein
MADADVDFFDRPSTQKKPAKNYENIVTDELLDRLRGVESSGDTYALNKQSKASGAYQFTPEQTITMHKKGIVFNPLVEKEARQAARTYLQQLVNQNEGDIKKALAQYGGFVKADPTEYVNKVMGVTTPKSPTAQIAQTSAPDEDVSFFQRVAPPPAQPTPEEKIGNQAAFGIYPRMAGSRKVIEERKPPTTEGMGGSLAAIGDVIAGAPSALLGLAGYGGLRLAGRTPEQAQETAQSTAGLIAQPIGKLTGTAGTPAYEKDVLTAPLRQFGQYTQTKAKEISQATGIPEQDVEFGLNAGMLAAPKVAKTVVPPVLKGLTNVGGAVQDVRAQMAQQLAAKQAQATGQPTPQGMQSGGAMAAVPETVLRANIDSALANASPELQTQIKNVNPQKVNIPALETRGLEEKHGVNLSVGQRIGDTQRYAQEWNARAETQKLGQHFDEQPSQISNAFETAKQKHAPDISSTADASELGQLQINALANKDVLRQQAISKAYKSLEDANGGQFPIDTGKLKQNIDAELFQKYKSRYLSEGISGDLKQFLDNPTFEGFEALRTNLADEMRSAKDGKTRQAAYIVREQLEKLPIFGEEGGSPQAVQLKALADNARKLYAERQKVIANNPAYKAAVKEASSVDDVVSQGESLNAAKFHDKYVAKATPEAIRRLKSEIDPSDVANQAITFSELSRAKNAAVNASERNLTPEQFARFYKNNKSVLKESLPPEAMQDVTELGLLTSKIGMPKTGTFNYSNTYSSMLGDLAKQGLLSLGEAKLAAATYGASVPTLGLAKQFVQKFNKEGFANEATNPFGGLTKD